VHHNLVMPLLKSTAAKTASIAEDRSLINWTDECTNNNSRFYQRHVKIARLEYSTIVPDF